MFIRITGILPRLLWPQSWKVRYSYVVLQSSGVGSFSRSGLGLVLLWDYNLKVEGFDSPYIKVTTIRWVRCRKTISSGFFDSVIQRITYGVSLRSSFRPVRSLEIYEIWDFSNMSGWSRGKDGSLKVVKKIFRDLIFDSYFSRSFQDYKGHS